MIRLNSKTSLELSNIAIGRVNLRWSQHAKLRAQTKQVLQATELSLIKGSVVEVELTDDGAYIIKLVVRVSSCAEYDAVYVIKPDSIANKQWFVITCWLNHVSDNHQTLNMKRLKNVS